MNKETKVETFPVQDHCVKTNIDPQNIMKRLTYKPSTLEWKNFQNEQPHPDRWIVLWCNLGHIAPNFLLSYRDATGNYDLPHPTKSYPVLAWAYIDIPAVDEAHLESIKQELKELADKSSNEVEVE